MSETLRAEPCAWVGCRSRVIAVEWLERPLCERHWREVCAMREEGVLAVEIRKQFTRPQRPAAGNAAI